MSEALFPDRREMLNKNASLRTQLDTAREEAAGWKREAERLLELALADRAKLEEVDGYKAVLRSLDTRFGCSHVDNGPEDCQQLIRHVDELFTQRDVEKARATLAEAEADAAKPLVRELRGAFECVHKEPPFLDRTNTVCPDCFKNMKYDAACVARAADRPSPRPAQTKPPHQQRHGG